MKRAKEDEKAFACIEEVILVLKKHGFVLGHEDGHGAFELEVRDASKDDFDDWLRNARLLSSKANSNQNENETVVSVRRGSGGGGAWGGSE